jgi:hypothetical protein
MFYAALPLAAEEVETQAILDGIRFVQKRSAENDPLGGVHEAFEDRVLDALSAILA